MKYTLDKGGRSAMNSPTVQEIGNPKYTRGMSNILRGLMHLEIEGHKNMVRRLELLRIPFYAQREVKEEIMWRRAEIDRLYAELSRRKPQYVKDRPTCHKWADHQE